MTAPTNSLIDIGADILSTILDKVTNKIYAYVGDVKAKIGDSDKVQWIQHVAFASLPSLAQAGKAAAQAVILRRSNGDVAIGSSDSRSYEIYKNLGPGEFVVYAAGEDGKSQGLVSGKTDGAVSLYTTNDNTATGKGVYLKVSPTALEFYAPWGRLVFDATGFHVVTASGARLDLGGIGGLPGPLSALGSYATLSAATVKCAGSVVMLGAGPVYNAGLYGLTGIAGLPSTGVFISV